MKIFLPFKKDVNPYLEEFIPYSKHKFKYKHHTEYNESYDIVNIHWPEAILNWLEPSQTELKELEKSIQEWKKKSILVYTKHDFERNKGMTTNFKKLFKVIEENTDVFIHLGAYSKEFYGEKYPSATHQIVPHPLFKKSFEKMDKEKAKKELGISKNSLVIIAPGNIRHQQEKKMVLKAFDELKIKDKVLICTNMRNELEFEFPGRVRFQKHFDVQKYVKDRFISGHQPPKYIFNYSPVSSKEISLRMSAADVVLVPRVNILNSGIVFLAASFNKVVVGPRTGNITKQLEEQNLPVFDPYSRSSLVKALKKGTELCRKGNFRWKNLEKYRPENIAQKYDEIFTESIAK